MAGGSFARSFAQESLALAKARVGGTLGGKFRLLRVLGVGGMAAVFEAQHRNGNKVALKVLHRSLDASKRERKRFLREAYVANTIAHAGVVRIFDDGVDDSGAVFLVMELLEGATLAELQQQAGGRLDSAVALDVADQLLDVLAVAHEAGVVHRDVKPANLFVTRTGQLKVLDFGIARVFEPIPGSTLETQSGAMLGTPAFMPQEQARGRWDEIDARSDLWAVGATLFTLLSGEHVHSGETPNEQLGRAMTMPARSIRSVLPDISPDLGAVIDRALRYERGDRWPDARSMRAALSSVAQPRGSGRLDRADVASIAAAAAPGPASGVSTVSASATSARASRIRVRSRALATRIGWASIVLIAAASLLFALREAEPERVASTASQHAQADEARDTSEARPQADRPPEIGESAGAITIDRSALTASRTPAEPAAREQDVRRPARPRAPEATRKPKPSGAPPIEPVDPLDLRY